MQITALFLLLLTYANCDDEFYKILRNNNVSIVLFTNRKDMKVETLNYKKQKFQFIQINRNVLQNEQNIDKSPITIYFGSKNLKTNINILYTDFDRIKNKHALAKMIFRQYIANSLKNVDSILKKGNIDFLNMITQRNYNYFMFYGDRENKCFQLFKLLSRYFHQFEFMHLQSKKIKGFKEFNENNNVIDKNVKKGFYLVSNQEDYVQICQQKEKIVLKKNYISRTINKIKGFFYDHIQNYEQEEVEAQNLKKVVINLTKNRNFNLISRFYQIQNSTFATKKNYKFQKIPNKETLKKILDIFGSNYKDANYFIIHYNKFYPKPYKFAIYNDSLSYIEILNIEISRKFRPVKKSEPAKLKENYKKYSSISSVDVDELKLRNEDIAIICYYRQKYVEEVRMTIKGIKSTETKIYKLDLNKNEVENTKKNFIYYKQKEDDKFYIINRKVFAKKLKQIIFN